MAEVVKTGLLAGREVWELPEEEMIRACAAYKAGVVLSDPYETEGRRALAQPRAHVRARARGRLRLPGLATARRSRSGCSLRCGSRGSRPTWSRSSCAPEPVEADLDAAWAALKRDKKGEGVFVLLEAPGQAGRHDGVRTTMPAPPWPRSMRQ